MSVWISRKSPLFSTGLADGVCTRPPRGLYETSKALVQDLHGVREGNLYETSMLVQDLHGLVQNLQDGKIVIFQACVQDIPRFCMKPPRAEPCAREGGNAHGRISAKSAFQMLLQAWCARNAYKIRRSLLGVLG